MNFQFVDPRYFDFGSAYAKGLSLRSTLDSAEMEREATQAKLDEFYSNQRFNAGLAGYIQQKKAEADAAPPPPPITSFTPAGPVSFTPDLDSVLRPQPQPPLASA